MPKERDCANCFHRKPVLKEDGTWTAECEKWDCEFQSRENMVEKTEAKQGDLISRSALIKAILEHCRSETENINHFWYDKNLIALIDNAPTVEPKQGEWIGKEEYDDYPNKTVCECSECGKMICVSHNDFPNFCDNCGAKMKGGAV